MASSRMTLRRWTILLVAALTLASCGSLTKTEVHYVRATRMQVEEQGFLRLAEDSTRVNVVGTKSVAEVNAAGYYLLNPDDLAAFVRAVDRLRRSEKVGHLLTEKEAEEARRSEK